MFAAFFYLLRQRGLHVSLNEWMTLLEGMEKGLHHSTLTGFYHLCRAIVVKNETEFDRFDQIFLEFFKNVPYTGELPEDLLDWLNHPSEDLKRTIADLRSAGFPDETLEELLKMLEERLKEQTEEHNGGNYWVGTQGRTPWGNSGWHPNGIRIGGQSMHRTAMMVAGERKFRDFRKDNKLDTRQFQMAFRRLCLYSDQFGPEVELDIQRTVHDTCQKGGLLQIRQKKPRRNAIKVLMFIDCGGTMTPYHALCSRLFQAVSRSNRFKDLKIYYFHNCIDEYLYTNPTLRLKYEVSTKKVLRECDKDYKVIFVGDATMDVNELLYPPAEVTRNNQGFSGQDWLNYILKRYRSTVWLTPVLRKKGSCMGTWGAAYDIITDLFQMYPLTVKGLEDAMEQLMVQK